MADLTERQKTMLQGYACAVATIVSSHGLGVEAEEALLAAGLDSMDALLAAGVDEIDVETLTPTVLRLEARHGNT